MDTAKESIRHLSLCSGCEGIGTGLRRIFPALHELAHVECEAYAISNLVAKMESNEIPPVPIWPDVKTFPFRKFRGCVDILSGGFPCPPFSVSNSRSRKSTEDPRHLFPFIFNGIKECRPPVVFLENVEGIITCETGDGEPVLKYVLTELESVGFQAEAGIFSAREVGAPHQRKRVFILAHSQHDGQFTPAFRRSIEETSKGITEGEDETSNFTGASEPKSSGDLQGGEQWVARPDETQHKWEAPRTISKSKLGRRVAGDEEGVDATANRVERIRLVGNGVCPAQVERAYRVLSSRL